MRWWPKKKSVCTIKKNKKGYLLIPKVLIYKYYTFKDATFIFFFENPLFPSVRNWILTTTQILWTQYFPSLHVNRDTSLYERTLVVIPSWNIIIMLRTSKSFSIIVKFNFVTALLKDGLYYHSRATKVFTQLVVRSFGRELWTRLKPDERL